MKAEDEGGLSSTATINIRVSDINDKNPEFQDTPYEFSIKEGRSEVKVGQVKATDADEGQNAVVYYSLPDDIPFSIQEEDGVITTTEPLDYEKQQVLILICFITVDIQNYEAFFWVNFSGHNLIQI